MLNFEQHVWSEQMQDIGEIVCEWQFGSISQWMSNELPELVSTDMLQIESVS